MESDDGLISDEGSSENIECDSDEYSHGAQSSFFPNLSRFSENKDEEDSSDNQSDLEEMKEVKRKNNLDA